jgi:hypothetical protein
MLKDQPCGSSKSEQITVHYVSWCGNTHMTVHLPLFSSLPFLTALLSLVSNLHTKSICNYFSIFPHSSSPSLPNSSLCSALPSQALLPITAKHTLAPSISVSMLAKRPLFRASASGTNTASHA